MPGFIITTMCGPGIFPMSPRLPGGWEQIEELYNDEAVEPEKKAEEHSADEFDADEIIC